MRGSRWPAASSDADFAPFLDGKPEQPIAMFWRFVAMAKGCGPVTFELQQGLIVLRGTRRIFASVEVSNVGLSGHINLTRRIDDRRIRKAEPLTKRLMFHRYLVTTTSDLDEEFETWLCEARAIVDGAHMPGKSG